MKKVIFWASTVIFFFTLTSLAFSENEAMTPEKISGIWEGIYTYSPNIGGTPFGRVRCLALFTPNLNGIMRWFPITGPDRFVFDGQGDIVNNQLIIRDRKNPDIIRIKAYITGKNRLEGDTKIPVHTPMSVINNFKKIRELTDEEKQQSLSQLEGLLK